MRRPHLIAVAALGALSVVLIVVSISLYVERPTVLRVAVSSADADDLDLMGAAAKLAKRGHHAVRLKLVPVDGVAKAAHALDQGDADLAVVRADVALPDSGETVVLLHKDVALLVAPAGEAIAKVGDLAGKRIGMLSQRAGDEHLLEAALGQYDIALDGVTLVPLRPEEVGAAVKARSIDAVFMVGMAASGIVPAAVKAIERNGEGAPVFIPVAEAAAIAERQPVYDSVEIVRGAFGGSPPRPADDLDTVGVTYRLVASADLADATVAALTRFLLSERVALADIAPSARRMTAPPTDRGAAIPVHPGTAAYIDDEEETFLDRYSDFIYIGAMVLGVFASGLTAVVSRLGGAAVPVESYIARLLAILKQVRGCPRAALLDQFEADVDAIVAEALDRASLRGLDERKAATLTMAVDQVRSAIHDCRESLLRTGMTAANDDPAAPLQPMLLGRKAERTGLDHP